MHGHPTITSTRRGRYRPDERPTRRRSGVTRLLAAGLVVGSGLVLTPVLSQVAVAASFDAAAPTRLYMAPQGTTLLAGLVGVPIGTLAFDGGTDVISQDVRNIDVVAEVGPLDCDTTTDKPVGEIDFNIDDCPRLQFNVVDGRLKFPNATKVLRDFVGDPDGAGPINEGDENPDDFVWRLPGGAIISSIGGGGDPDTPNDPAGHLAYDLSGTDVQINAAMDTLTFRPDDGYYYTDAEPEARLSMTVVSGDPNGASASHTVQIRVLDVNDAASLDGPASKIAQPEIELKIPPVAPPTTWPYAGSEWTVADEDNDEIVDTDTGDPGELPDGTGTKMLLIGYLDCSVMTPVVDQTGFRLRGGLFEANQNDIEALLKDFYEFTTAPAEVQTAIDGLLAAIDAIAPGVINVPLATSDPTSYTGLFAGITDIDNVAYALSQVSFLGDVETDTCTLYTVVSDLGNNGLPLQYIGDPPTGVEVPFLGVPPIDIVQTTINVGSLQTVDASFVPGSIFTSEPGTATATIDIEPDIHPEFNLRWSTQDGTATVADTDYGSITDLTITVPENAPTITIDANALGDLDDEGNENFTLVLSTPTDPPPGLFVRPFGWQVTSNGPIQNVIIVDDDNAPNTMALGDASVAEGDAGTTTLNIPVTLSGPADGDESVTVETAEFPAGPTSATSGVDFQPASVTVNFALGETQRLVPIAVIGDNTPENNEQFAVNITNTNVTPTDNAAVGTITDDDGTQPNVSINDVSTNEGNSGTTNFTFIVSLSAPAVGGETIEWSTADGAAVSTGPDADFAAVSPTQLVFATGEQQKTVTVLVNGDTDVEPSEAFFVNLGNPAGLVPVDAQGQGTIVNDDSNPNASITSVTQDEGDAGTSTMTFTIGLDKPALGGETVDVDDTPVTASEPTDYTFAGPQTVTFSPGDTSQTVSVTINGDTTPEADETFTMTLSNASSGLILAGGPATGTITNDDGGSIISIADATSTEGGNLETVPITMTNPAGRTCIVLVNSANGTAVAGAGGDYSPYNGTQVPLASVGQFDLALSVLDDQFVEQDETFTLSLSIGAGSDPACILGDGVAEITIVSDDVASVVSIADASISEPSLGGPIAVSMTNNVGRTCVVDLTSANVSATAGADYTAIAPATTLALQSAPSGNYQLTVANDATPEGPETFTVTIALNGQSDPQCQLGDSVATVTILDDDIADNTPPTVTVEQAVGQSDPTSASPIVFTVVFSEPVTGFATGDVTLGGTAVPTTADVIPVSSTVYSVEVSGMSLSGTVTASVAAGVAVDGASNPNEASTSTDNTVTYQMPVVDNTPPTVTVEQAVGQADPTSASPIVFTVVFSEPVTGFATGDVTLGGTAVPTTADVIPVSSTVYSVEVSGMSVSGTVIATVAAGVAQDAASNPNVGSSSTDNEVTYELLVDAPLTLNLPPNQTVNNDPGQAGAIVNYPTVTASGGVPPVVVDCTPISGAFFPLGTSTVSCTATDAEEGQQEAIVSGTFTITVVDNEPPTIADNPDLTRETVGNAPVTVTFPLPAASDNSGVAPTVVCTPASGATFGIGTSTVTCTATDGAGNSASSSFTVTVTSTGSGVPGPTTPTTTPPTTNPIFGLPATGSDPVTLLLVALALLSGGGVLVATTRRRRSS